MINLDNGTPKNIFQLPFSITLAIGGVSYVVAILTKISLLFFVVAVCSILAGTTGFYNRKDVNATVIRNVFEILFSIALIIGGLSYIVAILTDESMFFSVVSMSGIIGGLAFVCYNIILLKETRK